MVVRFLTCRIGPFHVHNEFPEPLRRRRRISPSPCRSGVMRGQRREGRNPSVEPERRSSWLRWQPHPPTNSSEEPIKKTLASAIKVAGWGLKSLSVRYQNGFSLVELLVVTAIIAINQHSLMAFDAFFIRR